MKVSLTTKWETNMQDKLTNLLLSFEAKCFFLFIGQEPTT